jgi:Flp pilus assembly protein TadB
MNLPRELVVWGGIGVLVVGGILLAVAMVVAHLNERRQFRARVIRVIGIGQPIVQKATEQAGQAAQSNRASSEQPLLDRILARILLREVMPRWLTNPMRGTMIATLAISGWVVFAIIRYLGALSVTIAVPAGLLVGWMTMRATFKFLQRREETRFLEGFPESLGIFVRMVRAGLPVTEAIRTVGMEGPPAVADVFKRMSDSLSIGDPMSDVLVEAARRLDVAEFRIFVVAVNIQRETGGNLAVTLDNLADIIRKRRTARQRALALMSEVKASIGILTALPFLIGVFLWFQNPDYISLLITTERGRFVLFCAIALLSTGLAVMQVLIKRTLRGT